MLGGEIMEAMTWASTSTYNGNKKFQDRLSCKSFVEKKQDEKANLLTIQVLSKPLW
jgi:hypothetical protein